jgi:uncharacterized protein (DUF2342 family)
VSIQNCEYIHIEVGIRRATKGQEPIRRNQTGSQVADQIARSSDEKKARKRTQQIRGRHFAIPEDVRCVDSERKALLSSAISRDAAMIARF